MVGNEIGFNSSIFLARLPAFVGPSLCFYVSQAPDTVACGALSGKTGLKYSRGEGVAPRSVSFFPRWWLRREDLNDDLLISQ